MKKMYKRILSTLLIAVLLIGIAPIGGFELSTKVSAKDISSCKVGDIIEFGSYPQSKITDSDLIAKIEAVGKSISWVDYNYYIGTGTSDDGNMKPVDGMMLYKDIPYNGSKYRAVKINQYRPYITGLTSSYSDQDDNGYYAGNIYYFKYEPLTWRVLDPAEGYVMCNKIIDSQAYQSLIYYDGNHYYNNKSCTNYAHDWVTSSLRQWLNSNFYDAAFTAEEKSLIGISHLKNRSAETSIYDSEDTDDKIFPISHDDAINNVYGFSSNAGAYDTARQMKGTNYAKSQGLGVASDGTSWWRLRSAYYSINTDGIKTGSWAGNRTYVDFTSFGVVPAFKFNPKSTTQNKIGDINTDGKINSADALLVLQSSTGVITLTDTQKLLADVNEDGKINSTDALLILQYATGKITSFK